MTTRTLSSFSDSSSSSAASPFFVTPTSAPPPASVASEKDELHLLLLERCHGRLEALRWYAPDWASHFNSYLWHWKRIMTSKNSIGLFPYEVILSPILGEESEKNEKAACRNRRLLKCGKQDGEKQSDPHHPHHHRHPRHACLCHHYHEKEVDEEEDRQERKVTRFCGERKRVCRRVGRKRCGENGRRQRDEDDDYGAPTSLLLLRGRSESNCSFSPPSPSFYFSNGEWAENCEKNYQKNWRKKKFSSFIDCRFGVFPHDGSLQGEDGDIGLSSCAKPSQQFSKGPSLDLPIPPSSHSSFFSSSCLASSTYVFSSPCPSTSCDSDLRYAEFPFSSLSFSSSLAPLSPQTLPSSFTASSSFCRSSSLHRLESLSSSIRLSSPASVFSGSSCAVFCSFGISSSSRCFSYPSFFFSSSSSFSSSSVNRSSVSSPGLASFTASDFCYSPSHCCSHFLSSTGSFSATSYSCVSSTSHCPPWDLFASFCSTSRLFEDFCPSLYSPSSITTVSSLVSSSITSLLSSDISFVSSTSESLLHSCNLSSSLCLSSLSTTSPVCCPLHSGVTFFSSLLSCSSLPDSSFSGERVFFSCPQLFHSPFNTSPCGSMSFEEDSKDGEGDDEDESEEEAFSCCSSGKDDKEDGKCCCFSSSLSCNPLRFFLERRWMSSAASTRWTDVPPPFLKASVIIQVLQQLDQFRHLEDVDFPSLCASYEPNGHPARSISSPRLVRMVRPSPSLLQSLEPNSFPLVSSVLPNFVGELCTLPLSSEPQGFSSSSEQFSSPTSVKTENSQPSVKMEPLEEEEDARMRGGVEIIPGLLPSSLGRPLTRDAVAQRAPLSSSKIYTFLNPLTGEKKLPEGKGGGGERRNKIRCCSGEDHASIFQNGEVEEQTENGLFLRAEGNNALYSNNGDSANHKIIYDYNEFFSSRHGESRHSSSHSSLRSPLYRKETAPASLVPSETTSAAVATEEEYDDDDEMIGEEEVIEEDEEGRPNSCLSLEITDSDAPDNIIPMLKTSRSSDSSYTKHVLSDVIYSTSCPSMVAPVASPLSSFSSSASSSTLSLSLSYPSGSSGGAVPGVTSSYNSSPNVELKDLDGNAIGLVVEPKKEESVNTCDVLPPVRGVYYEKESHGWWSRWTDRTTGKVTGRKFAVRKYGFDRAKVLAVSSRLEAEQNGQALIKRRFMKGGRPKEDGRTREGKRRRMEKESCEPGQHAEVKEEGKGLRETRVGASGVRGVIWKQRENGWVVKWSDSEGITRYKCFSASKAGGYEAARDNAIKWKLRRNVEECQHLKDETK